jgi:hypothetical protein
LKQVEEGAGQLGELMTRRTVTAGSGNNRSLQELFVPGPNGAVGTNNQQAGAASKPGVTTS